MRCAFPPCEQSFRLFNTINNAHKIKHYTLSLFSQEQFGIVEKWQHIFPDIDLIFYYNKLEKKNIFIIYNIEQFIYIIYQETR